MHKKTLLLIALFFNTSYGMENESNESPLSLEIKKFNTLLQQDLAITSTNIERLTTGLPDSRKCAYGCLASVGMCALACIMPPDIMPKMLAAGATAFAGTGALAIAAMKNENNKKTIYLQDQEKLNKSIQDLSQIINQVTHQAQSKGETTQTVNATTTSATKRVDNKNLELIQTCNKNYEGNIILLQKFIAEYPTSKICFYSTLIGMLLCSLAWLNNKNSAQLAGMGSILFLGAGAIGFVSANNENNNLQNCIENKTNSRESIMQINRS